MAWPEAEIAEDQIAEDFGQFREVLATSTTELDKVLSLKHTQLQAGELSCKVLANPCR